MRPSLLFVLVLCVLHQLSPGGGFSNVEKIQGKNYRVSYPEKANWFQAMKSCAAQSLFLVDAITTQENERILTMINRTMGYNNLNVENSHFWASGTSMGQSNKGYYWMYLALDFNFTYWDEGQPSKSTDDFSCVLYNGVSNHYHWNITNCLHEHYYICRDTSDTPMRGFQRSPPWADSLKKKRKCTTKSRRIK